MNIRRTHLTFAALAAATLLVATGCSGDPTKPNLSSASSDSADLPMVTINQAFQSLLYLPLYVADENGYFAQNGVDVQIDTAGGGPQAWAAVVGGSADFSIQAPEYVPIANEKGGSGVIVASVYDAPGAYIVSRDDVDMQLDLSGLVGKRIITSPEPDTKWAYTTLLVQENNLEDVELIPVSVGNEIAALLAGQGDFAIASEPALSQAELEEGLHVNYAFPENSDWYPYMYSSLTSTPSFLEEHPEETQAVVSALDSAAAFIRDEDNFEEVIAIAAARFPEMSEEVIRSAVQRGIDTEGYPTDVVVSEDAYEHNLEVQLFVGNVSEYPSDATSYENNVDVTFAEKARDK